MDFEIVGELKGIEAIAVGRGVRDRFRLDNSTEKRRWRKLRGFASVRLPDGTIHRAELHWYEAHGIGRREIRWKRYLD